MSWTDLVLRLRALFGHRRAEGELDEELSFHLEMEARKRKAAGMTDAEARQNARAQFGGVEQVREECRDVRGLTLIENLARDVRYGARVLRKSPVFTAIAVLSLAIGIGANTAVFSLIDTILLRMLPVRSPEQLRVARWGASKDIDVSATWSNGGGDGHGGWKLNVFSWAAFSGMRARSTRLRDVMGFSPLGPVNVAANGRALSAGAMVASGNYFQVLGVQPILGRAFQDDDDTADGLPAAVISYRFWDRMFGLDPSVIGKTLFVNGQPSVIVGVTAKEFFGVSAGGFMRTPELDIVLPIRSRDRMEGAGHPHFDWFGNDLCWIQAMGRLDPGQEPAAQSEIAAIVLANLPEAQRRALGTGALHVYLDPGAQGLDTIRTSSQKPLAILMAVVALTLLMACANLAGLLLARATSRQKEIMLRLAVGASRGRLVRQLLAEGAVLSVAGALAGLAFAWWGVHALLTLAAGRFAPVAAEVSPDARVLGFTAAISLVTTFLFALAPALRATRVDVAGGLKEDVQAAGIRRFGAGSVLVAVQVAVALVLLAGATLFTRSLANLRSLPLGFNPRAIVLFNIAPGKSGYDEARGTQFYQQLRERLIQTRGVTGVSLSGERLISGLISNGSVIASDDPSRKRVNSTFNFVGPDFFEVMGIPIVFGRGVEARDLPPAHRIAVINEALARKWFGGASPLGKRFQWSWEREYDVEVVGVVKDAKYDRLRGNPPATIFAPYTQRPFGWQQEMNFEVRTAGSIPEAVAAIRRAVASLDGMLPVTDLETQEAQIDGSLAQEHLFASLVSLFSAIALVLASVGLYGSVAYAVTRRTRELGLRMALGADRLTVLRLLFAQVAGMVGAGLAIGLPATWALTRVIESQLYGIKPHDPASLALACLGVAGVALVAAYLPARRAIRIDPVRALRYE